MKNLDALLSMSGLYAWHVSLFLVIVIRSQPEPIATPLLHVVDNSCALQKFVLRKVLRVDRDLDPAGCHGICDHQFIRLRDSLMRAKIESSVGYTTWNALSTRGASADIASTSRSPPIFETESADFASSSSAPPVFLVLNNGVLDSCQLTASQEHCIGTTRAVSIMQTLVPEGATERHRQHLCGLRLLPDNYTQCACEVVLKLPLVHTIAKDFMLPDLPKDEYCKGYNIAKRLVAGTLPPLWSCSYEGSKCRGGLDCAAAAAAEEAVEADPCICTGGEAICTRSTYQNSPGHRAWPHWPELEDML